MTQARKAELLLTYPGQEQQLRRITDIMMRVIDTGRAAPVEDTPADHALFDDGWFIKASVYGDYHYLWLGSRAGILIVAMNVMSWEPPWKGFMPGSTTDTIAKFSEAWIITGDKEMAQEAEFLIKEWRG